MGKIAFIVGVSLLGLFSCAKQENQQVQDRGGISFIDDDGNAITLEKPFQRIIALYSAHTENLFSIGAGPFVIGGHKTCTYPAQADLLPKFDYTGDPEYIIAAGPDLVLIRPFIRRSHPNYLAELEKAGIPVVSLYPERIAEFDEYMLKLALLTGKEKEAQEKLVAFHDTLRRISSATAGMDDKKTVFFESTAAENRTVSPSSLPAYAITVANGINIAAAAEPVSRGSSIALYGAEKLLEHADTIDVYIVQQGAMNRAKTMEDLRKRPGFSTIKALRENKVLFIDEKIISSPTFRYTEGVKQIAAFLYPEAFTQ
ncbi:MAG: ABC transporter substrate-binding protein [Treponema sp.]|jgi:iron complex transport system substrate-binding protein|nr:ABC transporter substrate-binding protein [Treponema sp.]